MGGYVSGSVVVKSVVIVNIQIDNMYFALPLFPYQRLNIFVIPLNITSHFLNQHHHQQSTV